MDHISISQVNTFTTCPLRWKYRYADGLIQPPGIVAHGGGGVGVGAQTALHFKRDTGKNMPAPEVVDAAVAGFDNRLEESDYLPTAEEKSRGRKLVVAEIRDRTASLGQFWAVTVQPDYMAASAEAIESRFTIPVASWDMDFIGYIDLIDDQARIVDWKTRWRKREKGGKFRSASPLSQQDADASLQLTAYSLAYEREHHAPPAEVRLHALIEGSKDIRQKAVSTNRNHKQYQALLDRVDAVLGAIRSGKFPPREPDWHCTSDFCGYAACQKCPHRIRQGEASCPPAALRRKK